MRSLTELANSEALASLSNGRPSPTPALVAAASSSLTTRNTACRAGAPRAQTMRLPSWPRQYASRNGFL